MMAAATLLACVEGVPTQADVDELREIVRLTVSPHTANVMLGDSIVLSAVGVAADSTPSPVEVTWVSDGGEVHPIGTGLARYVPNRPGEHRVRAQTNRLVDSVAIVVAPIPVASIALNPPAASLAAGSSVQLTAVLSDANGNELVDRVITWNSQNLSVATVDGSGLARAVGPGVTNIVASSEGRSGLATISVSHARAASVTLNPASLTLGEGATGQIIATVRDSAGNVLAGRPVQWSSSVAGIATVDQSGVVRALAVGTANITATSEGQVATATVTVNAVVRPPAPVASVVVNPVAMALNVSQSGQLSATLRDSTGALLTNRVVTWASSAPGVVSVNQAGIVTSIALGTATITATSEGISGSATVNVAGAPPPPAPVATVTVNPATLALVTGQSSQLSVTLRDAAANQLFGRVVTYASSNTAAATVSAGGLVTATGLGAATITVTSEGQTGTSAVTVTPVPVASVTVAPAAPSASVGQNVQFSATTRDASGNILTGRVITWATSNGVVAGVNATGLASALAAGTATITASSEGQSGTATLSVSPVPVASVTISPTSLNLVSGQSATLVATPRDAGGTALTGRAATWVSSAPGVATVNAAGQVTAGSPGTATITVTVEGVSASVTATVAQVPVATVTVTPPTGTLTAGQTGQASAVLRDAAGNVLTGRVITWSTSAPAVATVSATGLVTGVSVGTATITATSEGRSGSTVVTISQVPVGSVSLSPASLNVVIGATGQLTATVRDPSGNILTGRITSWSSSAPGVATVSPTGLVTGVSTGTATITVTCEGRTASVTVTVGLAPVATVSIAPTSLSLFALATGQLTATLRDAAGNVLTGRVITWSTSDPAVALVNGSGLVTGAGLGTATVTATSEGRSASVQVDVLAAPVATVSVAPATATINGGATTQLTATLRDAGGNILTGRVITWSSSAGGVASVSATGLVTGIAAGTATITATSEGRAGTATITVTVAPVATVTLAPTTLNLSIGGTGQVNATLRDAAGNVLTGRVITWTSSASAVATVSATGLVTGVSVGVATITATSEGRTATVAVTVSLVPVATVTLSPTSLSVSSGGTGQLTATMRDASGNILTGRTVTWSTSSAAIATVSSTGLVTGVAAGTATITATSEGRTATATVTVLLAPVATVTVTPNPAGVQVGSITTLTVTLRDAGGNVLTGRVVTWSSSNNGVATVNTTGVVTGVAAGTATITATSEGRSGSTTVTASAAPPPPPPTVGEPVYNPANSDHKLHVFEDWSKLTSIAQLFTTARADGGAAWVKHASTAPAPTYMSLVNQGDGFGSARHIRIDFTSDPPIAPHGVGGPYTVAHTSGFHWSLGGGDDNVRAEYGGAVSSTSSTTLTDASKNWPVNIWAGHGIDVYPGANLTGTRLAAATIVGNTANTLTISGSWNISGATSYVIGASGPNRSWIRGFDVGTFLNTPTKGAIVYEFALRHTGSDWYSHGKLIDIGNVSGGVGRFNYDPFAWNLGVGQPSQCNDVFCPLYYSNNGATPRFPGLPPTHNTSAPAFARSQSPNLSGIIGSGGIIIYKQNKNWGTGSGQFAQGLLAGSSAPRNADLTGTGKYMHEAGWLYTKIRITREPPSTPYVYGQGRIEVWVGKTPGSLVKVMEYLGDNPADPSFNRVWVDPTGSSPMPESIHIAAPTDRNYKGGAFLDVGTFRVWSHSR